MTIEQRKYPYPFRALLSISNDIDGLTYDQFLHVHRFLNTEDETELGEGLNLDVADSFWFYSVQTPINDAFTYFDGLHCVPCPYADSICHLVELGYIDTLHTWGNFSQKGGFLRYWAEKAVAAMLQWKRRPLIWTDHGDCHNYQNIGNGLGDLPEIRDGMGKVQTVLEYHSDLMTNAGLSFVCRTKDVTPIWGQERKLRYWEHLQLQEAGRSWKRKLYDVGLALTSRPRFERFLEPYVLRDERQVWRFVRFLPSWQRIRCDDLEFILSKRNLDRLEKDQGVSCILTHLGFGSIFPHVSRGWLDCFRQLAERQRQRRILILSTKRLLLFLFAQKNLCCQPKCKVTGSVHMDLSWPTGIVESIQELGAEAVDGLTFYVQNVKECTVSFCGQPVVFDKNPPDESGRKSITLRTWHRPAFPYRDLRLSPRSSSYS